MITTILLAAAIAAAPEITAKVTSVADGDTCTVLVGTEQVKIRLHGIDAPERKQPYGTRSRERLGELIHDKQVRIVTHGRDRYGRTLGTIYVGDVNVNETMVRDGLAWHYRRYSRDPEIAHLEAEAREAKRGLWSDPNPVPPWEWRKKPPKQQNRHLPI